MKFRRGIAAGLAILTIGLPGLAQAADNVLTLVMGGEGFDGPPKFAVSFGGEKVGDGVVGAAIDTATDGRFADAADQQKFVQSFSFKIPDAAFKADAEVGIRLTNEAHGAAGSRNDRELYVRSVAVNGMEVPAAKLGMRSDIGIEPTAMLGDYLVVTAAAVEGVAKPPEGGWGKAGTAQAAAAPTENAAPVEPPTVTPASEPADVAMAADKAADVAIAADNAADVAVAADKPAEVEPAPVPPAIADAQLANAPAANDVEIATAERQAEPEPAIATPAVAGIAGGDPDPEAGAGGCGLTKAFQITGFSENSNELTPRVNRQLDAVAAEIGAQRCIVHVSGYSSTEGDFAHNALFSIERAQNALRYLSGKGVKFRRYSANGVGETTQFGLKATDNRRVVVTVSP